MSVREEWKAFRETRYCTLINDECKLIIPKKYISDNRPGSEHCKTGRKVCSRMKECEDAGRDCKWASGTSRSTIDPMEDL